MVELWFRCAPSPMAEGPTPMTREKPWLSAWARLLHSHYLCLPGAAHFRRRRPSTSCHTYWIGVERCSACRFGGRARVRELCVLFKQGDYTRRTHETNTASDVSCGAVTKRVTGVAMTKWRGQYWLHTRTRTHTHAILAWSKCDQFGLVLTLRACGFLVIIIVNHHRSCTISTVFNH